MSSYDGGGAPWLGKEESQRSGEGIGVGGTNCWIWVARWWIYSLLESEIFLRPSI